MLLVFASAFCIVLSTGCSLLVRPIQVKNWDKGYTIILPGIESRHLLHRDLALGLHDGGVHGTIEIYDWTTGLPPLMLLHLRGWDRNQRQAQIIAHKIVDYQNRYPDRPVHLIGHSGGGGIVLLTLEELPEERQVDTAIILNAAISPKFDLRHALRQTRCGLWNFSSMIGDSPLLISGTTIAGTIDGRQSPAAGAVGFFRPANASQRDTLLYESKLHEMPYRLKYLLHSNFGGHYGTMTRSFAAKEIAPILVEANQDRERKNFR